MPDGPSTDAVLQMAKEMGRVAGTVEQVDRRVGEVGEAVKDLAETNATDHQRTAVQLAEIKQRLSEGDRRIDGLEKRVEVLEHKPKLKNGNGAKWPDVLKLAKDYGPYVFGALVALWAYLTTGQTPKGGSSP